VSEPLPAPKPKFTVVIECIDEDQALAYAQTRVGIVEGFRVLRDGVRDELFELRAYLPRAKERFEHCAAQLARNNEKWRSEATRAVTQSDYDRARANLEAIEARLAELEKPEA
jgi:hypothetical protein